MLYKFALAVAPRWLCSDGISIDEIAAAKKRTLFAIIESGVAYNWDVSWTGAGDRKCSKVLDVEFDETFIPEQC